MNEYEETKALLGVVVLLFGLSLVGHGTSWGYLVAIAGEQQKKRFAKAHQEDLYDAYYTVHFDAPPNDITKDPGI